MKRLLVLIACLALNGCAVKTVMPGTRFMSPESSGAPLKGEAKLGVAGSAEVQIADNVTSSTPDTTPKFSPNTKLALGAQLGIAEIADVYLSTAFQSADYFGVKVQILGDSAAVAKKENFSLAIAGAAALGGSSMTTETGGIKASQSLKFKGWEALVMAGYRPSDNAVVYLSPFVSNVEATARIERTPSGGTSSVTAEPNGRGDSRGVALGVRIGTHFITNFEVAYIDAGWTRTNPTEVSAERFKSVVYGLMLGGAW